MTANDIYAKRTLETRRRGQREGVRMVLREIRNEVYAEEEWGDLATHEQMGVLQKAAQRCLERIAARSRKD